MKETDARRVAIYVRDTDFGQETALRAFAGSRPGDWHIVKVYTGNAHTSLARDGAHMLRDAKAAVFTTLLVHSLDRLSRNLSSLARLLDALADANVAVRSATEPMVDTSTPVGRLMMAVLGMSAELDRTMRRRISAGRRLSKSRGSLDG